jgi:hypothetical protein
MNEIVFNTFNGAMLHVSASGNRNPPSYQIGHTTRKIEETVK